MKEIEKAKIKLLSDRLDLIRHKMANISPSDEVEKAEKYAEFEKEKVELEAEIAHLKAVRNNKLSKEAQKLEDMPFKRLITKKEQADIGKLKKAVRGLVIVHPMTALGREMELEGMTGFSKTDF
ncbi:YibL family ribosome-associated protein [Proteus sp. G2669]|uniref:YibL family ribosome-associated protein n=1 Tax=unclassified Proteus (in: enterobacteria) TaxID=257482 RepID=UPI001411BBC8|nr:MULTISPECIES: YibL family ribosome-associated protein [unclassified Proteus (in: enterobacteria)]NBM55497.1 YibL family ribosome-associated protein [Proteus sp. G2669]UDN35983.1 YibL family ribosome-associated protein [Proteus sp. NMG38-2]